MSIEAIRAALDDYMAATSPAMEPEAETGLARLLRPSTVAELLDRLEAAENDARRWRASMAQPWVLSSMPGGKGVSLTLSIYGVKANPDMEPEDAIDAAMEGE